VHIDAPAKINLSLEITGRRADGYHDIVSIMQTISLTDSIRIEPADDVSVVVSGSHLPKDNLVARAANRLRDYAAPAAGCAIALDKHVPIAAGLGGGSGDAAATLLGLGMLWDLDLRLEEYMSLAAELGSDVPFFVNGGTALVEGRGERLTPLWAPRSSWYLLANPGFPVSTASVYAALRANEWSDGKFTRSLASRLSTADRVSLGVNALQSALFRVSPEARECFSAVASIAPEGALVSGSGPTVFAPFADAESAIRARNAIRAMGLWAEVAESLVAPAECITCE
jgi:4-diphosphocytidyl-2-C-methyl-D-erythritol kinase